jgi:hypothetical protein
MVGVLAVRLSAHDEAWQFYKVALAVQPLGDVLVVLLFWVVLVVLCAANLYGGGDAKVLMVLFGLWPRLDFLLVEVGISLLISVPLLIRKYWGKRWPEMLENSGKALWQKREGGDPFDSPFDSAQDAAQGRPFGAVYALGGIVFTWLAAW